jgi:hypothetical protein
MSRSRRPAKSTLPKPPETSAASSGASATRLLDAVVSALPQTYHGVGYWIDSVSPEAKAELDEIKQQFLAGAIKTPRRTLAKAISKQLVQRGICKIGFPGVEAWLQRG